MRRSLITLAALAACSSPAWAQASATVFGIVDLAVRWVDNDDSQWQLASGGNASSRIGVRGSEDLGGDLSAAFWLEGSLDPDTGNALQGSVAGGAPSLSGGFTLQRRSTLSLISRSLGELRLGRDKVPTYFVWETYNPFRDAGVGNSTRLGPASVLVPSGGAYSTFVRADNSIAYFLPDGLGGVVGQFMVALDEGVSGNGYWGGSLGYRAGPLSLTAAYGVTDVSAGADAKAWNVGGWYDLKVVRPMAFYSSIDVDDTTQTNILVGFTAPLGGVELRAMAQWMDGDGRLAGQEATMVALGGVYALSKRTALYATYSHIDNDNTGFAVASGPTLTVGTNSSGFEFGVRHSF
jgi:predicted porin